MSAHHIELFIQTILAVEDAYVNSAASMERRLCLVERLVSSLHALGDNANSMLWVKILPYGLFDAATNSLNSKY